MEEENTSHYNIMYVFDIPIRRCRPLSLSISTTANIPLHDVYTLMMQYPNRIWVFCGGNGLPALNDVRTLDVGGSLDQGASGLPPRGHHMANPVRT